MGAVPGQIEFRDFRFVPEGFKKNFLEMIGHAMLFRTVDDGDFHMLPLFVFCARARHL
jgi:hypothetical protein